MSSNSVYFNSLKSRLIISGLFIIVVLLPLLSFIISNAYQKHMKVSIENELVAYSYSILSVAEVEQGQLLMPEVLVENQFNTSESGLYALITSKENIPKNLWRSGSLLAVIVPHTLLSPDIGQGSFYHVQINDQQHFIYSFSVRYSEQELHRDMTLHIIKNQSDYLLLISEFKQKLWIGLLLLMIIFLVFLFIWLRWSLKPLSQLKTEIESIEQGKANLLQGQYPDELKQVTEQLNMLLITEQNQRKRYRNSLSDLAHSLKTPLAVLQGQLIGNSTDDEVNTSKEQLDAMNLMIEHQLKRAQSAGQSSWHLGVEVEPIVEKLLNSLKKIYRDKQLRYQLNHTSSVIFKGDEADLLEMLGNLLDNASKAAHSLVSIDIIEQENRLIIAIEDDGKGIPEDQVEQILQRGTRVDTYQQGHGIGLAIVRDLVDSYQGQLNIAQSTELGGAKFTLIFSY